MRQCKELQRLAQDDSGATAIEYGAILALIAIAIIAAVQAMADRTIGLWDYVKTMVDAAM